MAKYLLYGGILIFAISAAAPPIAAAEFSPVGLWKTVDDKTGEPKSFLRIGVENGELFGRVEKLIRKPGQDPNPLCDECPGEKKNKPIMGMVIMWGLTQEGDEWTGGHILDPDNGKTYKCKVKVIDNGTKINIRGYIGFSLIGRTQTWLRAE